MEGLTGALLAPVSPAFVLDHKRSDHGYLDRSMRTAEKLTEERDQIVAARWAHVGGLSSNLGCNGCRKYLRVPEGRT